MQTDKFTPSSSDKTIGWICTAIGIFGILYAAMTVYNLHNSRLNYTVGKMIGGFVIFSLIPFLFLNSGRYYLAGKNAERKAKKNQGPTAIPPAQNKDNTPAAYPSSTQVLPPQSAPDDRQENVEGIDSSKAS
jgi:hypothetical protein